MANYNTGLSHSRSVDMTGKILDSGTIVEDYLGVRNKNCWWNLKCVCGKHYQTCGNRIRAGSADLCRSCKVKKHRTVKIIGTDFGNNCKVLKEVEQKYFPNGKPNRYYLVECHCGEQWQLSQTHILNSKVQECAKCGHKTSAKNISGENHWNYRGVPEIDKKRGHSKLRRAKKKALRRDGYKCYITGATENLEVHHIESWDRSIEGRFDPTNMITLSYPIHRLFHDNYGLGNNTREQFNDFVNTLIF